MIRALARRPKSSVADARVDELLAIDSIVCAARGELGLGLPTRPSMVVSHLAESLLAGSSIRA